MAVQNERDKGLGQALRSSDYLCRAVDQVVESFLTVKELQKNTFRVNFYIRLKKHLAL